MLIAHDTCVLVADGEKMLFFRNSGDAEFPKLELEAGQEERVPPDRNIRSDAAGRSLAGGGNGGTGASGGGSLGTTDFHQQEEERFALEAADELNRRALASDFDRLIVVAPPRTLGAMRKRYHQQLKERLVGELAKDLTNHPVVDIERTIAAA